MREINKVNSKKKKEKNVNETFNILCIFQWKKIYEWILHKVEKAFSNRKVNPYKQSVYYFRL